MRRGKIVFAGILLAAAAGATLFAARPAAVPAVEALPASSYIKWVDFNVPADALDRSCRAAVTAHEEGLGASMPDLLACLAAGYWGNWKSYRAADLDRLMDRLRAGETLDGIGREYKDYPYYKEAYGAVLDGMVGDYAIALPGEDGEPRWQVKYGLKAYCPVAEGFRFSHCDDFGNARSFGYRRRHLGNDLMGSVGSPIVAVESGVVEELGWNQYGGWRVGIRSFDGRRYYYYAHLRKGAPYQPGLERGNVVQAGDVIGYLGMTGYSRTEDVNGMKVPHLHFGMQLIFDESQKTGNGEIWIDVCQLVNFLERNRSTVDRDDGGTNTSIFPPRSILRIRAAHPKKSGARPRSFLFRREAARRRKNASSLFYTRLV